MDNFKIDVVCEGAERLKPALEIAFGKHKATHYTVHNKALVFFWTEPKSIRKDVVVHVLPFSLTKEAAPAFVNEWLKQQDYGKEPDHDGSNSKGWRVFNESWGQVFNWWEAFVAIEPVWAMYGK